MTKQEMTKNLKRLPKKILSNLESLSEKYLLYIISNQGLLRFRPWNSQIQYLVTNTHRIHLNQALITYDTLKALNIHSESILNVGTGGGYLEYVCKYFDNPIKTVEYFDDPKPTDGVRAFRLMRTYFGVNIDYTMNDVNKDNFTIHKCEEKFDWLIFFRFFYHSTSEQNDIVDYEKVYKILSKFEKYGNNCIILGRKETQSFYDFKSLKMSNFHHYGNIKEIINELKTKIL